MKVLVSAALVSACLCLPIGFAQESGPDSSTEAEAASAQGDERELTRAERREQRRQERDARRAEETAAAAVAESAADDDEGLVCRRESRVGTHQRVRVCTTRAEREAARESAREVIRETARNRGDLGPEGD